MTVAVWELGLKGLRTCGRLQRSADSSQVERCGSDVFKYFLSLVCDFSITASNRVRSEVRSSPKSLEVAAPVGLAWPHRPHLQHYLPQRGHPVQQQGTMSVNSARCVQALTDEWKPLHRLFPKNYLRNCKFREVRSDCLLNPRIDTAEDLANADMRDERATVSLCLPKHLSR